VRRFPVMALQKQVSEKLKAIEENNRKIKRWQMD
jgi:hypothetical protein